MATKAEELENGVLSKVADDEPIFVLRAKDKLAADVVLSWISKATVAGVDVSKISEAADLILEIFEWQGVNGSKLPD